MAEPIMYIVVNSELNMSPGKMAAQVGHAVGKVIKTLEHRNTTHFKGCYKEWEESSYTKIVLSGLSSDFIKSLHTTANMDMLYSSMIVDEGRTEIPKGSVTCIAFEPMHKDHPYNQRYLRSLKLY